VSSNLHSAVNSHLHLRDSSHWILEDFGAVHPPPPPQLLVVFRLDVERVGQHPELQDGLVVWYDLLQMERCGLGDQWYLIFESVSPLLLQLITVAMTNLHE
jgi:hypothetical protein